MNQQHCWGDFKGFAHGFCCFLECLLIALSVIKRGQKIHFYPSSHFALGKISQKANCLALLSTKYLLTAWPTSLCVQAQQLANIQVAAKVPQVCCEPLEEIPLVVWRQLGICAKHLRFSSVKVLKMCLTPYVWYIVEEILISHRTYTQK